MSRRVVLALLATACSENDLNTWIPDPPDPMIEVTPLLLDFGEADTDDEPVVSFTIRNAGEGLLQVSGVAIDEGSFSLAEAFERVDLDAEGTHDVGVRFLPSGLGPVSGQAVVASNDPDRPEVTVDLIGSGIVPWLVITPDAHDFGALPVGCGDDLDVTLLNDGGATLVIDGVTWGHDGQWAVAPEITVPLSLDPGERTTTSIAIDVVSAGLTEATLTVSSNDPRGVITAVWGAEPVGAALITESFVVPADPAVDVLLAVDRSCSMQARTVELGANFGAFVDALSAVTEGWQLGVVTLDSGCFNNGLLTAATPDLAAEFVEAVTQGDGEQIQDHERLLELSDRALGNAGTGECNEGFARPDTMVHVMVLSDEPEQSVDLAAWWTWSYWLDRMRDVVSYPERLRVSGVIDLDDCGGGPRGYEEAIAATGGAALSICDDDWGAHAAALAEAVIIGLFRFPLSQEPDPSTLTVSVDGAPATGWTYDATDNAIVFDHALAEGTTVGVTYTLPPTCP